MAGQYRTQHSSGHRAGQRGRDAADGQVCVHRAVRGPPRRTTATPRASPRRTPGRKCSSRGLKAQERAGAGAIGDFLGGAHQPGCGLDGCLQIAELRAFAWARHQHQVVMRGDEFAETSGCHVARIEVAVHQHFRELRVPRRSASSPPMPRGKVSTIRHSGRHWEVADRRPCGSGHRVEGHDIGRAREPPRRTENWSECGRDDPARRCGPGRWRASGVPSHRPARRSATRAISFPSCRFQNRHRRPGWTRSAPSASVKSIMRGVAATPPKLQTRAPEEVIRRSSRRRNTRSGCSRNVGAGMVGIIHLAILAIGTAQGRRAPALVRKKEADAARAFPIGRQGRNHCAPPFVAWPRLRASISRERFSMR